MTPQQIRDAIVTDPALQALAAARNDAGLADALSVGRTKQVPVDVGNGTLLDVLGLTVGNALIDLIHNTASYRYVVPLLDQGRLRLDSPLVQGTLAQLSGQQIAAGVTLDAVHVAALNALCVVDDPVSTDEVSAALNEAI
jgi:hypothetical protein